MAHVVLHGSLKKFGGPFDLGAQTAGEAVRALCIMVPGFRQAITAGNWRVVRGKRRKGLALGIEDIGIGLGPKTELHIAPAPKGSGGSRGASTGKIIIGVVMIAAVVLTAGAAMPAMAGAAAIAGTAAPTLAGAIAGISVMGISGAQIALMGAALLITGVSQMLSPQPKESKATEAPDQKPSYLFSGVTNQTEQGVPIPLAFGEAMTGSIVVSAGLDVETLSGGDGYVQVFDSALVDPL